MKLLGLDKISVIECEIAKKWLISWISEIRDAHWRHAEDIVKQFPRVSLWKIIVLYFRYITPIGLFVYKSRSLRGLRLLKM
jgi:mRNA interferase HigB